MSKTAWYTFGNHFHWVDMQWLWGYGVLGASMRDMLELTRATGAPGNLNFDGVGYERLASEDPAALDLLRDAVREGRAEVVGATYGQPYGLFHHGESAVRQLSYGVRAVQRLLGVRPRSFWEEEFCFFPQLPQLLADAGYEYASLFFQWTWHTPHVPSEDAPAIWWTGIDGSRILTLPAGPLNLHQWPEDFEALVTDPLLEQSPAPVVQQWLELLPSPDWMCRAELIGDGVQELFDRADVEFRVGTISTVLDAVRKHAVERSYSMDDVFHGMSLGKNGDLGHRRSRRLEQDLLAAEAMAVLAGMRGRPYPHWDAYPGWELEETWRELLTFQHHDNDECEGLCGHVGYAGLDRGAALADHVVTRTARMIAARAPGAGRRDVALNPLGWDRDLVVGDQRWTVPAFGAVVLGQPDPVEPVTRTSEPGLLTLSRGGFTVVIDRARGVVTHVGDVSCGRTGLGALRWERDGAAQEFAAERVEQDGEAVIVHRRGPDGESVHVRYVIAPEVDALDIRFTGDLGKGPDGRAHAALMTLVEPDLDVVDVLHDTPYAVSPVEGRGRYTRKYPTGDWMTSRQVYEEVSHPFTALQLIDLVELDGHGLLWIHDGSQGFHRATSGAWNVLSMRDPWDEKYYVSTVDAQFRVVPHEQLDHATRWRLAQEMTRPVLLETVIDPPIGPPLPQAPLRIAGAPAVVATALYRDTELATRSSAGHVNTHASAPVLLRLVEMNGNAANPLIEVAGTVHAAWRTNALGEMQEELTVRHGAVEVAMSPRAIATVALDIEEARPVARNLDAHRDVWATAHRDKEDSS